MRIGPVQRAGLLARTVVHLRPAQIIHRVRLRGLRWAVTHRPAQWERRWRRQVIGPVGWPEHFVPIDRRVSAGARPELVEACARGEFSFLGEHRILGSPPDWRPSESSQLWRYHLHYWEWGWGFVVHPERAWASSALADTWRSWRAGTTFGRWDEWSPYVVSLRAWVLCGLHGDLVAHTMLEEEWAKAVALHGGFLAANLESDVGGNHLVKNLKALIGCGVFLGDDDLVALGVRHLRRQLGIQILADGGHFERSPSYHAQVLGDLMDVQGLLDAAQRAPVPGLTEAVAAMRSWLGALLAPDGEVPLLGDASPVGVGRLAALGVESAPVGRLVSLATSGYVVGRPDDRTHVVLDIGGPCPPTLPAHAQAGFGSFLLHIDGRDVVVDTGLSTYAPGARRRYERSTAAHNTVELDGADQTEVWGSFRAARLARPDVSLIHDDGTMIEVVAGHDGYRRLPGAPVHRRRVRLRAGAMEIVDDLLGSGRHRLVNRLHLAPGLLATARLGRVEAGPVTIQVDRGTWEVGTAGREPEGLVAVDFGELRPSVPLRLEVDGELPIRVVTTIRW